MRIGVIGIIALMFAAVTQAVAEDTATAQPTPAEPTAAAPYLTPEQRPDVGNPEPRAAEGSVAFETDRADVSRNPRFEGHSLLGTRDPRRSS